MPSSPCLEAGCGNVSAYRGRCAIHSKDRERETHRTGRLEPKSGRMYGRRKWTMAARQVRNEEPLCRACIAEGQKFPALTAQVDHIVSIEQGGAPYDRDNLQGLCASHHSQKTNLEQRSTHARSTR